ncbi:IS1 family transposase [Oscillospiraceae bacterium 21-37]
MMTDSDLFHDTVNSAFSPSGTMVSPQIQVPPERRRVFMEKLYQIRCPKCNNKTDFYRYGKDTHGHQKYQCKQCRHQWVPEARREIRRPRTKNYPSCPLPDLPKLNNSKHS